MGIAYAVGQKLSATRLNARLPITAIKSANTSLTSTITFAADTDIVLTLKANTTYDLKGSLVIFSAANAAGDFQMRFSWTNTATYYVGEHGLDISLASGTSGTPTYNAGQADNTSPSFVRAYGASTSPVAVKIDDRIVVGGSDCVLTLEWTQNASNASSTTLGSGSWLTAYPVL